MEIELLTLNSDIVVIRFLKKRLNGG